MGVRRPPEVQPGKLEETRSCVGLPAPNPLDLPPPPWITRGLHPLRMVYLGRVYDSGNPQAAEGACRTGCLGSLSRSVSVPGTGGSHNPRASWPLAPLLRCPAYEHSGSPVASEETGQDGGAQGTGCGAQGGNEGTRPWVGLDRNVCRASCAALTPGSGNVAERPTLRTHTLGGISCRVVKNVVKFS